MDEYINTVREFIDADSICVICNAEFLDTEDLNIHISQNHLNEASKNRFCAICHRIFPDIENYALHIRNFHLNSMQWCKYCTRIFFNATDLNKHVIKHNTTKFSCSQCKICFLNRNDLESHEYTEHRDNEGIMLQECFPILSSLLSMNIRNFFAVPYTESMYECINCEFATSDVNIYIQHLKSEDFRSFTCNTCYSVYNRKPQLRIHLRKKCVSRDGVKKCQKCKNEIDLKQYTGHLKQCTGLRCVPCDTTFASITQYTEHLQNHKKTIPLVTCKFCQRQFVGNVAMEKHIDRLHKKSFHLYKYKCVDCEQIFKHPKYLFAHFFTKHKTLQPYTCKICDKKFRIRKGFTLHIKLDHKSVGYVEFDENYHVFFTDKKSEKPFQPHCLVETDFHEEDKSKYKKVIETDRVDKVDLVNVNSDFMIVTETECETENVKEKKLLKRKRKLKLQSRVTKKDDIEKIDLSTDDSDEPLINVKKRPKGLVYNKMKSKNKFICQTCNKNCYTYQNYHHHLSLHTKDKRKKCIKCGKEFKSKHALEEHIETNHSSSKLTETLKQLLERRKNNIQVPRDRQSISDGLRKTIQKVHSEPSASTAKITAVENGLSVKNFIENFRPDDAREIKITSCVTLKEVTDVPKPPTIKLTKFSPEPKHLNCKLRMPVKFKQEGLPNVKATIKIVQTPINKTKFTISTDVNHVDHSYTNFGDEEMVFDDREEIPEVAEEVMLEEDDYRLKETQNTVILPNIPENCDNVKIAHLQPQAPYYKIVSMKDVIKNPPPKKPEPVPQKVTLPDGTKLVTVNPLAHLLRNTNVDDILKPSKQYYVPKHRDIRSAIEKAMTHCRTPRKSIKHAKHV